MTDFVGIIDVCEINPSKKIAKLNTNEQVSFVEMSSVSEDGKIINEQTCLLKNVAKGFTYFVKGDIILAKITPCFENGKRAYVNNIKNTIGFGSTEFLVLRPNEKIVPEYLYYMVSRKKFREDLTPLLVGTAGQKRLHKDVLANYLIPLPSKQKQFDIVNKLKQIEKIKKLRITQNEAFDELIKSKFLALFGNPSQSDFSLVELRTVAKLNMGGTPSTQKPEYYVNGDINWMKSGDIKSDFVKIIPNKITKLGLKNSNAKMYSIGDVVIALNGQGKTRATTGILKIETASNQSVASISPNLDVLLPDYLHFDLKYRYQELRNLTGDKQRSGLNLNILRQLEIPLPPRELQSQFGDFVRQVEIMREKQNSSKIEAEQLFESVLNELYVPNVSN